MALFAKKPKPAVYDLERLVPVIRKSICTGEAVAAFREKESGRLHEVMLLKDERDLADFRRQYGITEPIETIY